ncbi:hypothetical protein [Clostridium isatidis]|uniref:hypothetical protein n=1 Tax=Clostridium isatidis TaxID=182773 RepID=UPI003AADF0B3
MKKFIISLFISAFLSSNIAISLAQSPTQMLTEGVYRMTDITIPIEEINFVQNISENEVNFFIIVDENNAVVQSIRLEPNSEKFKVAPLKPGYRIIIVDYGTVVLSKE